MRSRSPTVGTRASTSRDAQLLTARPTPTKNRTNPGVGGVANPAVRPSVDDGLVGMDAHVDREEATEHEDRPLAQEDPGRHQHETDDEERPVRGTDRSRMPMHEFEPTEHSADDGGDDDQETPPLCSSSASVEAAPEAHGVLAAGEETEERPEGDVRARLLVRRRHNSRSSVSWIRRAVAIRRSQPPLIAAITSTRDCSATGVSIFARSRFT